MITDTVPGAPGRRVPSMAGVDVRAEQMVIPGGGRGSAVAPPGGGHALRIVLGVALGIAITLGLAVTTLPQPAAAAQSACTVHGTVLDSFGQPVPGIRIRLALGVSLLNTATDERGAYAFSKAALARARAVDRSGGLMSVDLMSEEWAHDPGRFTVLARQVGGVLRSDRFTASDGGDGNGGCRRDFDLRSLPAEYTAVNPAREQWPDLVEIYQRTQQAWTLADRLGVDLAFGVPLRIYAWCDDPRFGCPAGPSSAELEIAGFAGTRSDGSYVNDFPFIVLSGAASAIDNGSRPDNREYHEIGHFFQSRLFANALPLDPRNVGHGGYYRNPSSSDSWVEGFATFYSLMVSKHVDGDPSPERYRLLGAEYDLELNHQPWEWSGWWEELTVAGLLLDFEDGDSDYARQPQWALRIDDPRQRRVEGGRVVEGTVTNTSRRTLSQPEVVVEMLDDGGRVVYRTGAPTIPTLLSSGQGGHFTVPVPASLVYSSLRVTPGPLSVRDDDPINVTLNELLEAITTYRGDDPNGNGYVFDVAELYEALRASFGGVDRDRDGVDDVDQVFLAHGLFADTNGNHRFDGATELIGLTSHPASAGFDAALPRTNTPLAPEAVATIDTGGRATEVVVYVSYEPPNGSRSYGYVVTVDDSGAVPLAAPPRELTGHVSVVALAEGWEPTIAVQLRTDTLWSSWDHAPGESSIRATATMRPATDDPASAPGGVRPGDHRAGGDPAASGSLTGGSPAMLIGLAAIVVALVGGAYAVILRQYFRGE